MQYYFVNILQNTQNNNLIARLLGQGIGDALL